MESRREVRGDVPAYQKCPKCLTNQTYKDTPKVYNATQLKYKEEEEVAKAAKAAEEAKAAGEAEVDPEWNRIFRCERCKESLFLEPNGRIRVPSNDERGKKDTGRLTRSPSGLVVIPDEVLDPEAEAFASEKERIVAGLPDDTIVVDPLANDQTVDQTYGHDPVLNKFLSELIARIREAVSEHRVIAGRFSLSKIFAKGANSLVTLAKDKHTGDSVVLKFPLATAFEGAERELPRTKVKRAHHIQLLIDHPNSLRPITLITDEVEEEEAGALGYTLDVATVEQFGFIVVEPYIEGITLKEVLQGKKKSKDSEDKPVAEVDKPVAEVDKPVAEVDKPVVEVDKPVAEVDKPVAEVDKPEESEIKAIPEVWAIEIAIQIGGVLQQAWNEYEIIHRDIKPDNIMIVVLPNGQVLAIQIDWGEARSNKTDRRDHSGLLPGELRGSNLRLAFQSLTMAGVIIGTPHYISPEQVGGGRLGHWTDQYGLAATIYHLVTGQTLFAADSMVRLIEAVEHRFPIEARIAARANGKAVSRKFSRVLMKALEKEPRKRYRSPEAFIKALEACRGAIDREEEGGWSGWFRRLWQRRPRWFFSL